MRRRLLWLCGGLLALPVVLLLAALLALQVPAVQRLAAERISALASGPESVIRLEGLSGRLPFAAELARLELSDRDGLWLSAEAVSLRVSPLALLAGRVEVDHVTAGLIRVLRRPLAAEPAPAPTEPAAVPSLPMSIALDRIAAERIELAPPVLGEPAALALEGRLALPKSAGDMQAMLRLHRLDRPGLASLVLDYARAAKALQLELVLQEPAGGMVAALLALPDRPPVALSLAGKGPLPGWQGRLEIAAEGLAGATAELAVTGAEPPELSVAGQVDAAGLLPAEFRSLLRDGVQVDLVAAFEEGPGRILLRRADLASATLALGLTGSLLTDGSALDLTLQGRAPDLAELALAFGQEAAGIARLSAEIRGALLQPEVTADLALAGGRFGPAGFESLGLRAQAAAEGRLDGSEARLRWSTTLGLLEPRLDGAPIATLGDRLEAEVQGSLLLAPGTIILDRLQAVAGPWTLSGSGRLEAWAQQIAAEIRLAADDLGGLGLPLALAGRAEATAEITAAPAARQASVRLQGASERLQLGLPAVQALLGESARLDAMIRLSDGLELEQMRLEAGNLLFTAAGRLQADFQHIEGHAEASLPRLAPLAQAIGQQAKGRGTARVALSGTLAEPQIEGRAALDRLVLEGRELGQLALDYRAERLLDAPRGRLRLDAATPALQAALAGRFALTGRELTLSDLSLDGPASKAAGELTIDLDRMLTRGSLKGRFGDLAPWGRLAGIGLAGSAAFDAELGADKGEQRLRLQAQGANLRLAAGAAAAPAALQRLTADVRLEKLFSTPGGSVELALAEGGYGTVRLESLNGQAKLANAAAAFTVTSRGRAGQPFSLDLRGLAPLAGTGVTLERLQGTAAGQRLALRRPLQVAWPAGGITVKDLDLGLGPGSLRGDLVLTRERLGGRMTLVALPLALVELARPDLQASGRLNAELKLDGAAARPAAALTASVEELRLRQRIAGVSRLDDLPALSGRVQADWRSGRLAAEARIGGIPGTSLEANLNGPLELAADGSTLTVPQGRPVSGRLAFASDLAALQAIMPLGDDRYGGRAEAQASLGGQTGDEQLRYSLSLSDGRYESAELGTVLNQLRLVLQGDRRQAVLEQLAASDGERGTLSGQGRVALDPEQGFPVNASIRVSEFRAVRRDDADVRLSGGLAWSGGLRGSTLSGRIEVERAELGMPERQAADIAQIDVIEVNGQEARVSARAARTPPSEPGLTETLKLDIAVVAPARIFVRGRGLESEWRGDLQIRGSAARPDIQGNLTAARGTFDLAGRTFVLDRGIIRFVGGSLVPVLDLLAVYTAPTITARAIIEGEASKPKIRLESEPQLPQDEILSRVLFGTGRGSLTALQAAQLAEAALTLSGRMGGGGVLARLRGGLGLDRLDVRSSGKGEGGVAGSSVNAGRYVSDRVYVGVEQGIGSEGSRVSVEIQLLPNVTVESKVGANSESEVGINWKLDY